MKKFLFDLLPLILFFAAYKLSDIYTATTVTIIASWLQIICLKMMRKAIETTHWINLIVIVLFGGATLWLQSDIFIKWKPTVLYWLFGAILLGTRYFTGRNLIKHLIGTKIYLTEYIWSRLNTMWAVFFLAAGAANILVAFSGYFTESQWVNFKVFGLLGLILLFIISQSLWLSRHMQSDPIKIQDVCTPSNGRDCS